MSDNAKRSHVDYPLGRKRVQSPNDIVFTTVRCAVHRHPIKTGYDCIFAEDVYRSHGILSRPPHIPSIVAS